MNVALTLTGIIVPSLLLAVALRRWITPLPWRVTAIALGLTLAFLHGAAFSNRLPVPVDEVARGYPGRGILGEVVAKNPSTNDTVKLFLPWMQVSREELSHARLPLWNRYSFSGYPLLANAEAAPFSPLFLATLFVPLPKQIVAMAGLKLFVSLLFTFLFIRRIGGGERVAWFAAIAFAFSSFETVWLYYSVVSVTAFFPAVLYAVLSATEEPSRRHVVLVALVVATIALDGHPESVVHEAVAVVLFLIVELIASAHRRAWLRRLWAPIGGAMAGVALAAPVWIPAAQQVVLSTRYADLHKTPTPYPGYPLTAIWTMLNPNGFGSPARGNWSWYLDYMGVAPSYLGLLVLLLASVALFSRSSSRRIRGFTVMALLTFLAAMNWTPLGHLFSSVPPLSFTANDKLRFASLFFAATASALWLERIDEHGRALLITIALPLVALSAYVFHKQAALLRWSDTAGIVAVIVFVAIALLFRQRPRLTQTAAAVLVAVELFAFNANFNRLVDARYFRPSLPIVDALHRFAPGEPFRIAAFDWMFLPNASAQYGLEDVRGADPMSSASYTTALRPITDVAKGTDVTRVVDPNSALLDFLNVRFMLTEPNMRLGGRWHELYRGVDGVLYENGNAMPRFFAAGTAIAIRQLAPTHFRLQIDAPVATRIESSQPAAPGWLARSAGRTLRASRTHDAFLVFDVPAGKSTVDVIYRPLAFYAMLPVALLAALALAFTRRA